MTTRIRAAAVLLAAATAASAMGRKPPAKTGDSAPVEKKMTIQEWKGQHGGPVVPGNQIVYDDDTWKGGWKELGQDAPPLDFARFAAVFVYVGHRTTGGY